jgi:hypothetical protein
MIFRYWELQRDHEARFLPMVPIRARHNGNSVQFDALVDSGAEHNVFSLEIAEEVGLSLRKARHVIVVGAGGHEIDGLLAMIELQVARHRWTAPTIFSAAGQRRAILGQIGFFAFFTVTFRYAAREIDIRRNRART